MKDRIRLTLPWALLLLSLSAYGQAPTTISPHRPWTYPIRGTLVFVDAPAEDVEVDLRDDTGDIGKIGARRDIPRFFCVCLLMKWQIGHY